MINIAEGINKKLIAVKINFFFQFCAIAALFAYMSPILATYGLNSYQLGVTTLFANACSSVSRIIFGMIVDRTKHRNYVLMALSSVSLGLMLLIFTIPRNKEYLFHGNMNENGEFLIYLTSVSENNSKTEHIMTPSHEKSNLPPCWSHILKQCKLDRNSFVSNDYHLKDSNLDKLSAIYANSKEYSREASKYEEKKIQANKTTQLICQEIESFDQSDCIPIVCERIREASWPVVLFALVLRCLLSSANAPISNLLDSATFSILGTDKAHYYGKSRALGSLGFMIGSLLTGFAVHYYTPTRHGHYIGKKESSSNILYYTTSLSYINQVTPNYTPAIIIAVISIAIGTIASVFCNYNHTKPLERHFTKALSTAMRSPTMIQCLMVAFMTGLIISFISEYNYLILTTVYHVPHYFLGLLITTAIIVEIPTLLFISGILVKRFGIITCQVLSQIMLTIRFLFYAFSLNYWYFLIGEIAYGICFPILMNALLSQTEKVSLEKNNENYQILTSLQAILTSTMYGLSSSLGGLLWGLLLQYFNANSLFFIAFIYTSICTVLFPIAAYCLNRLKRC